MEPAERPGQRDGSIEVFAIIEAVIGRANYGWGVRELAEVLGASRSTVNRILARLVDERLVSRDASGAYSVGPRLKVLSRTLQERHPLFTEGARILSRLSKESGATAVLAIAAPQPEECFVIASKEPDSPVRYTLNAGTRVPTHAGALGLAILSRRGTEGLPAHLKKYTDDSIDTRQRIDKALASYSSTGTVISIGQHIPDAAGIAVPFNVNSALIGSISLSRPRNEFVESAIPRSTELLQQAAVDLESALQGHPPAGSAPEVPESPASTLVERIARLLTGLCLRPLAVLGSGQLATVVGARSVASRRLADSASEAGLMTKLGQQGWTSGPTLLRWAAALGADTAVAELVNDDLLELAEKTGETVGLALLDSATGTAHIAATRSGTRNVRYVLEVGSEVPLHAGATGKAILAQLPDALSNIKLEQFTEHTVTDPELLRAQLREIRTRGWATGEGERIPEAYGTAAPFFVDGRVRGSVTVTVPRHRMADVDAEQLAAEVVSTAAKMTRLLSADPSLPSDAGQ